MTALPQEALEAGACADIPEVIVDKLFFADGHAEAFNQKLAKAICGRCVIQYECLVDALENPSRGGGVRGGETGKSIVLLARDARRSGTPIEEVATETIDRQLPLGGLRAAWSLKRGHMPDATLIYPVGSQR